MLRRTFLVRKLVNAACTAAYSMWLGSTHLEAGRCSRGNQRLTRLCANQGNAFITCSVGDTMADYTLLFPTCTLHPSPLLPRRSPSTSPSWATARSTSGSSPRPA